ncbi:hypothetical protein [Pontimicrobium sp. MEBiC01747]
MTNKTKIFSFLFPMLFVSFLTCNKFPTGHDKIEEWAIYEYYYDNNDLLEHEKKNIVYSALKLFFNFENKKFNFKTNNKLIKGDFIIDNIEGNIFFLTIKKSNDIRFNDKFLMKIDTIKKLKNSTQLRLIIESERLYMLGKRTVFEMK